MAADISALVEKSKSTDIPLLLKAKEEAKKKVKDDPSAANLAAFKQASRMLDAALASGNGQPDEEPSLKSVKEVAQYLETAGRKTSERQIFRDIKAGKLHREKNGTFLVKEINRYSYTRPVVSMPGKEAAEIADAAEQKLREEVRRLRAVADREEFDLAVKRGQYLPKDDVYLELAVRALALQNAIKNAFEAHCVEAINLVEGKPNHADELVDFVNDIVDNALNEYAQPMNLGVEIVQLCETKP